MRTLCGSCGVTNPSHSSVAFGCRRYLCKEAPYGGELSFSEQNMRDMHKDPLKRLDNNKRDMLLDVWTLADGFTGPGHGVEQKRAPSWLQPACHWYSWTA